MPILDNFDSQFFNEASQIEDGLMSSSDKVKLDSISLKDIDYILDGLEDVNEQLEDQFIYGIKIDTTNPDKNECVTYTDDAVRFTPLSVNQTNGICSFGSWKPIIDNVLKVQPCLVNNNGQVVAELDPYSYNITTDGHSIDIKSGNLGQVMVRFNHVYYRYLVEDNFIKFQISNKKIDNTWIDSAFVSEDGIGTSKKYMYISAYEAVQRNNILQSISDGLPSFKLPYEKIEELSRFGVFHMMNIVRKQFIIFLGYLVTKSIDLQGNIGTGNVSGELLKTGTMNKDCLFYGTNTGTDGVKMFGIENLWGNQLKYMHGLVQKLSYVVGEDSFITQEQRLYAKEFYPYNKIKDFTDCGEIEPNTSGFISSIKFLLRSIYMPDGLNGSSNTYFSSYYQNGEATNEHSLYGIYGGSNQYGDKCGPEFLLLAYLDSEQIESTTHLIY